MLQELEIVKAKQGVTADELRSVLKHGEVLVGEDYLKRMKEIKLLGDVSFVAEIAGSVYLISYYNFEEDRKIPTVPLKNISSLKKYMEIIEPLFEGAELKRLQVANSFWIDAQIKQQLG